MARGSSKHVFISYQHRDKEIAAKYQQGLTSAGFNVWWDERLQTGQKWHQEIDNALLNAVAVIVLWSESANNSEWVRHEASIANIRNVLTHASIDGSSAPDLFNSIQCADLSHWKGSPDDPTFLRLVGGIRAVVRTNRIRHWYRIGLISLSSLLIAGVLVYGGFKWQEHSAGPQNVITSWNATTDMEKIDVNLKELREFYSPDKWDIAIKCKEEDGPNDADMLGDENASFAFIPISKNIRAVSQSYKINFYADMADKLSPESLVGCSFSVVEKALELTKLSQEIDGAYQGFKWTDAHNKNGKSFNSVSALINYHQYNYRTKDICKCAADYQQTSSVPPK